MKKPKSPPIQSDIETSIANHFKAKTAAEFVKERLSVVNATTKNIAATEIIDNAIAKAMSEDRPEWSKFLFELIGKGEDKAQPQMNIYIEAADLTNTAIKKIINVTPQVSEKKGIEKLI